MKITKTELKKIIKEELESVIENSPAVDPAAAIAALLDFTIQRVISAYDGEVPPSVQKMDDLIKARDYDTIRSDFNLMWTNLVQYHRDNKIKLKPQAAHNFRSINTTVNNLPLGMK